MYSSVLILIAVAGSASERAIRDMRDARAVNERDRIYALYLVRHVRSFAIAVRVQVINSKYTLEMWKINIHEQRENGNERIINIY